MSRNLPQIQNAELFEWLDFLFDKWKNINDDVNYYKQVAQDA